MFSGIESHQGKRFVRGRHTGQVSPVRFVIEKHAGTFSWRVCIGISGIPIARGPSNSVSEGRRIFREAEDRYWKRRKARRPKKSKERRDD